MKDLLTDEQNEALLKVLTEAIQDGPWEESNFLRVIGNNLKEIRQQFVNQLDAQSAIINKVEVKRTAPLFQAGQQEVFVSLYSSEGQNLQSWERILANLPRQMISRPIYEKEEHVQEIIKIKENKQNEAYVVVSIAQSGIIALAPDKIIKDKLGNALLTLKDRSLAIENVVRFVHLSGVYHLVDGRLTKS